jgi:exopolyphosphatase / guanosine-5'-triphosphate,3'-diphosphate pyrophosphatase
VERKRKGQGPARAQTRGPDADAAVASPGVGLTMGLIPAGAASTLHGHVGPPAGSHLASHLAPPGAPPAGSHRVSPGGPDGNPASLGGLLAQPCARQPAGRSARTRIYAALDLGTNNCRLLVAQPSRRGGFKVIDAFSRIIRLGEGVAASRRLSDEAIERTIEALKVCAEKMQQHGVERAGLIATEACRLADNAPQFLGRVRKEIQLDIKVVSREAEARLAVSGCASLIDANSDLVLVFDIGGGSSELIWLDLARHQRKSRGAPLDRLHAQSCIVAWTSLPAGVVTLAERFGSRVIDAGIFESMVTHVTALLVPFVAGHGLQQRMAGRRTQLLGTSGTVTTVAGVHLELSRYDRKRIDGFWLNADQVRAVTARLLASSHAQRVAQPCIGSERAGLVLAGCAILEAVLRAWPSDRLRVADRGLREGILATLMAEDGIHGRPHGWAKSKRGRW